MNRKIIKWGGGVMNVNLQNKKGAPFGTPVLCSMDCFGAVRPSQ